LHTKSKTYNRTPSDLLGIRHPWVAWQLNNATLYLGTWIENKLNKKDKKGRPIHKIESLLESRKPQAVNIKAMRAIIGDFEHVSQS
jgi:hypothetical protein